MEYIAKILTNYIFQKGMITEKSYEAYMYGFQCFLELSISIFSSIIISVYLKMIPECLFFFLFFIPLRSYGGGLHLKTFFSCFISSCIIITSTLLTVKYLDISILLSYGLYIISAFLIIIIGPVDHPNREVNEFDNTIFVKRTYICILISLIFSIIFVIYKNAHYMLLEAIVFSFVFITSLTGKI